MAMYNVCVLAECIYIYKVYHNYDELNQIIYHNRTVFRSEQHKIQQKREIKYKQCIIIIRHIV